MVLIRSNSGEKISGSGTVEWLVDVSKDFVFPVVGRLYQVSSRHLIAPGQPTELRWTDDPETLEKGIPGNSNPRLHLHTGWRGTTNDVCIRGLGVRRCEKFTAKKCKAGWQVWVRFGVNTTPED